MKDNELNEDELFEVENYASEVTETFVKTLIMLERDLRVELTNGIEAEITDTDNNVTWLVTVTRKDLNEKDS